MRLNPCRKNAFEVLRCVSMLLVKTRVLMHWIQFWCKRKKKNIFIARTVSHHHTVCYLSVKIYALDGVENYEKIYLISVIYFYVITFSIILNYSLGKYGLCGWGSLEVRLLPMSFLRESEHGCSFRLQHLGRPFQSHTCLLLREGT